MITSAPAPRDPQVTLDGLADARRDIGLSQGSLALLSRVSVSLIRDAESGCPVPQSAAQALIRTLRERATVIVTRRPA